MTPPDGHDGDDGPLLDRVGLARGLLVIVTAVAVGAFVLVQGLGGDDEVVTADQTATSTTGPVAASTIAPTTAPEVAVVEGGGAEDTVDDPVGPPGDEDSVDGAVGGTVDGDAATTTVDGAPDEGEDAGEDSAGVLTGPGDTTVLVLNAAGAKGVAGRGVEVLDEAGYDTLAPKNATALGPTRILHADGSEAAANAVAVVFGLDAAVVAPLSESEAPIEDTQQADVVVVIGNDGLLDP